MNNSNTMDEIRNLQDFFTNAHTQLKAGQILDMSGIEERISAVCKAAQQAEPDLQQKYLPELTVLIELLNTYEQDLRVIQSTMNNKK